MNPNDRIRHSILAWFYTRNASATSRYGQKGSAVKISEIKKALKESAELTQQQVMSNLTYLIDKGWINLIEQEKRISTARGTFPASTTWYEISASGIDMIEGGSEFQKDRRYADINISAVGTNVITLGDGNVVNAEFEKVHESLNSLKAELIASDKLSEEQKLSVTADIESLKDQLVKSDPNHDVVRTLWQQVQNIATIGGVVELSKTVHDLLRPIIGG